MGIAGGVIGLIAGIFGVFAAIATLFVGGLGSVLGSHEQASNIIGLGWGGILFSFLVIVFGAVGISNHKIGGFGLVIFSLAGVSLGGTIVALSMALSLTGGVLCLFASIRKQLSPSYESIQYPSQRYITYSALSQPAEGIVVNLPSPLTLKPSSSKWLFLLAVASVVLSGVFAVVQHGGSGNPRASGNQSSVDTLARIANGRAADGPTDPLAELARIEPAKIEPNGELAKIFELGGDHTDLQRENKFNEIKGRTVAWALQVYDVSKVENSYTVTTQSSFDEIEAIVHLSARNEREKQFIEALKTGDTLPFKGTINDLLMRSLVIEPAILNNGLYVDDKLVAATSTAKPTVVTVEADHDATLKDLLSPALDQQFLPDVKQRLKKLLGNDFDEFLLSFNIANEGVVTNGILTVSGCRSHMCPSLGAAISVDTTTGSVLAVGNQVFNEIAIYGSVDRSIDGLPQGMRTWIDSLSEKNSASKTVRFE